jgi:UDP-N-acetylglucosamine:LPS N-acetylglucosamine transferase
MNILLINYEYPPIGGGAATATAAIASHLTSLGHAVTVLTSRFRDLRGSSREGGVHVVRCPAIRKRPERSGLLEMFSYLLSAGLMLGPVIRRYRIEASIVFFSFPCGPLGLCAGAMCLVTKRRLILCTNGWHRFADGSFGKVWPWWPIHRD